MAEEFVDSQHSSLRTVLCLRKGSAVLQASLVDALAVAALGLGKKAPPSRNFCRPTFQNQEAGERDQCILKSHFLLNKFPVRRKERKQHSMDLEHQISS